jgi:hypothetical protein
MGEEYVPSSEGDATLGGCWLFTFVTREVGE